MLVRLGFENLRNARNL
uniref:Uncharacterized protein n=1 Tax=Arundo donax TaxID=35708 RepID=A0A0A8YF33_ARUDO